MIPKQKRTLPVADTKHFFENSLQRYYNILTTTEMLNLAKKTIKEGVFIRDYHEPNKWYSILPCSKKLII